MIYLTIHLFLFISLLQPSVFLAMDSSSSAEVPATQPSAETNKNKARQRAEEAADRLREEAQKQKQEAKQEYTYAPNEGERPEVKVKGDPTFHIHNIRHPVMFNDRMHQHGGNAKDEEEDAIREGELQAKKEASARNHSINLLLTPESLAQKEKLTNLGAYQEQLQKQAKLNVATSSEGKKLTEAEIDAEIFKRQLAEEKLKQANPFAKRLDDAKEDIRVKSAAQDYMKQLLDEQKLNQVNLQRQREVAKEEGISQALATIAAKEYMRTHDYDQTFKGKLANAAKEIAVRLTIEALVIGIKQGGSLCLEKTYELYLKLPFKHCRELKEQQELLEDFRMMQAKQQAAEKEKISIQECLKKDSELLDQNWQAIQRLKVLIQDTTDEKEKQKLQTTYDMLCKQHKEGIKNNAFLNLLNIEHQPQFKRLIIQKKRQIIQQKEEAAAGQGA